MKWALLEVDSTPSFHFCDGKQSLRIQCLYLVIQQYLMLCMNLAKLIYLLWSTAAFGPAWCKVYSPLVETLFLKNKHCDHTCYSVGSAVTGNEKRQCLSKDIRSTVFPLKWCYFLTDHRQGPTDILKPFG